MKHKKKMHPQKFQFEKCWIYKPYMSYEVFLEVNTTLLLPTTATTTYYYYLQLLPITTTFYYCLYVLPTTPTIYYK